jgi:hypothetical protein
MAIIWCHNHVRSGTISIKKSEDTFSVFWWYFLTGMRVAKEVMPHVFFPQQIFIQKSGK